MGDIFCSLILPEGEEQGDVAILEEAEHVSCYTIFSIFFSPVSYEAKHLFLILIMCIIFTSPYPFLIPFS